MEFSIRKEVPASKDLEILRSRGLDTTRVMRIDVKAIGMYVREYRLYIDEREGIEPS